MDISSVSPVKKQNIKDALIIDDVAGYNDINEDFKPGFANASWYQAAAGLPADQYIGLRPEIEEKLLSSTANTIEVRDKLLRGLSSKEKAEYERLRNYLTDAEGRMDLKAVIYEVNRNTIITNSSHRKHVIDALIIDDVAGYYEDISGTFKPGFANASWYQAAAGLPADQYIGLRPETEDKLLSSTANTIEVRDELLSGLSPEEKDEYMKLRDQYLTDPEGRDDLKAALCVLDPAEPFCPEEVKAPAFTPNPVITEMYPGAFVADGEDTSLQITASGLADKDASVTISGGSLQLYSPSKPDNPIIHVSIPPQAKIADKEGNLTFGNNTACTDAGAICIAIPEGTTPGKYILKLTVIINAASVDTTYITIKEVEIKAPMIAEVKPAEDTSPSFLERLDKGGSVFDMRLGYGGNYAPEGNRYAMADFEKPLGDIHLKISPLLIDKPNHQLIAALTGDYAYAVNQDGGKDEGSSKSHVGLGAEYTPAFPDWWQAKVPIKLSIDLYNYSDQFPNPNRPVNSEVVWNLQLRPTLSPFDGVKLSLTPLLGFQRRDFSYNAEIAQAEFEGMRQSFEFGMIANLGEVKRARDARVPFFQLGGTYLTGENEVPNRNVASTRAETRDISGVHLQTQLNLEEVGFAFTYNHLRDGTRKMDHFILSGEHDFGEPGQFTFTLGRTNGFPQNAFMVSNEQHPFLSDYDYSLLFDDSSVPLYFAVSWENQLGPAWTQCFSLNAQAEWQKTAGFDGFGGGIYAGYDFWKLIHGGGR